MSRLCTVLGVVMALMLGLTLHVKPSSALPLPGRLQVPEMGTSDLKVDVARRYYPRWRGGGGGYRNYAYRGNRYHGYRGNRYYGYRGNRYYGYRGPRYYAGRYNWRHYGPRYRYRYPGYNYYYGGYWYGFPWWSLGYGYYNGYGSGYGYRGGADDHVEWCLARYRSYNPRTDTFLGYDGQRHYCNSPYR